MPLLIEVFQVVPVESIWYELINYNCAPKQLTLVQQPEHKWNCNKQRKIAKIQNRKVIKELKEGKSTIFGQKKDITCNYLPTYEATFILHKASIVILLSFSLL